MNLLSDEALSAALKEIDSPDTWSENTRQWVDRLAQTLSKVASAGSEERASRSFQQFLWENGDVAAVGQGNISVQTALDDASFREWLTAQSLLPVPASTSERMAFLVSLYEEIQTRLRSFLAGKIPHLKIFRVLAALFPDITTTVCDRWKMASLARAMGAEKSLGAAAMQVWVRSRIDTLLGAPGDSSFELARRMVLPWLVYERFLQPPPEKRTEEPAIPGESPRLHPLPASQRLRGLTAIRDRFPAMLEVLQFAGDGPTREQLLDHLRETMPDVKTNSLKVVINTLRYQFDVLRLEGERYFRTERGENVLATQDPSELGDWLLTRIFGVDHVVAALRDRGPLPMQELVRTLQLANPGWRADFAPQSMLGWLRSLTIIALDADKRVRLTEIGDRWASWIHWAPESLPSKEETPAPVADEAVSLDRIVAEVQKAGYFPAPLIARLHASLWAHKRRHFAVLTGLSGSGKTLLAQQYARALTGDATGRYLRIIPVQPGWFDPSALLGYTNPLRQDLYIRTPFLQFLLAAAEDPGRKYVAVLDEMNLSHPEQYMAPLLSTMETGDAIRLHAEEESLDGVPGEIQYPCNLALIGTVNMDETTNGLSDKVLDRAFVIDFWDIDLAAYPKWNRESLLSEQIAEVKQILEGLMRALAPARLHFGWRVVGDILDYLEQAAACSGLLPFNEALDQVIAAKILPKLRGEDSERLRTALKACQEAIDPAQLPNTSQRLREFHSDLITTGSARFWR